MLADFFAAYNHQQQEYETYPTTETDNPLLQRDLGRVLTTQSIIRKIKRFQICNCTDYHCFTVVMKGHYFPFCHFDKALAK